MQFVKLTLHYFEHITDLLPGNKSYHKLYYILKCQYVVDLLQSTALHAIHWNKSLHKIGKILLNGIYN